MSGAQFSGLTKKVDIVRMIFSKVGFDVIKTQPFESQSSPENFSKKIFFLKINNYVSVSLFTSFYPAKELSSWILPFNKSRNTLL